MSTFFCSSGANGSSFGGVLTCSFNLIMLDGLPSHLLGLQIGSNWLVRRCKSHILWRAWQLTGERDGVCWIGGLACSACGEFKIGDPIPYTSLEWLSSSSKMFPFKKWMEKIDIFSNCSPTDGALDCWNGIHLNNWTRSRDASIKLASSQL